MPNPANIPHQPRQTAAQNAARNDLEGRVKQYTSAIADFGMRFVRGNVAYADDCDIPNEDIGVESGAGAYLTPEVVQCQQTQPVPQPTYRTGSVGIEVTGPDDFVRYINDALDLLKTGDGKWYGYVDEGIRAVRYEESNGRPHLDWRPAPLGEGTLIYPSKTYKDSLNAPEIRDIVRYAVARIIVHEAAHEHRDVMDDEDKADAVARLAVCEIASINRNPATLSYFNCSFSQK